MTTTTLSLFRNSDATPVAAGEALFHVGDPADEMYVVQSGRFDVRVGGATVEVVGEGGIVGELALIDGMPRSADVIAMEDSRVVPIDERRFVFMVGQTPHFALTVMRVLAERIRRANATTVTLDASEPLEPA